MIVEVNTNSDFTIHNLPFGIFSIHGNDKRIGVAIGDKIIDITGAIDSKIIKNVPLSVTRTGSLNDFIALGKEITSGVRNQIKKLLTDQDSILVNYQNLILNQSEATMHMPVIVGDYTDFYSSIEHATNVGMMFRDPENALLPNWRHIPVGYHGRSSSIVISGTPIHRPYGQQIPKGERQPIFGPSKRLDFELETAFIIGRENKLGHPITIDKAREYIFGMVLFNDWSARDIQKWEYVPLGPFLGKNFASHISPWIVTMDALEPFRVKGPVQEPKVLEYLDQKGDRNYDIHLEVRITPDGGSENIVSRSNFKYMYWSMEQQLAHHTVNGCNVRVGDMMGSGTISGKDKSSYGSMLELSWAGTKPLKMEDGSERTFIEDGDTVTMKGYAKKDGIRVGFGEVSTKILPALEKNN